MPSQHDSDSLVPVSTLPKPFQGVFDYRYFNSVQSESFETAYGSDDNMVVSAPTGSGKTGLFELCILRLLTSCLRTVSGELQFNHPHGALKIVYVAPTKALIQEKMREWQEKFGSKSVGLTCQELTSDSDALPVKELQETDLILTTPEKFDSTTRRCRDHGGAGFVGDIALLLIDEVHLLNDTRGAALEAIVSRIKMLARNHDLKGSPISQIRFVAVSATIPNIEDLAEWLLVPAKAVKRFGEEMRPVKLSTRVYGYPAAKNDFLFEKRLQYYIYDVILQHSSGKPTLVFCPTRKGAQDTAMKLAEIVAKSGNTNPFLKSQEQFDRLRLAISQTKDKTMQYCIQHGVGFHNGGLEFAERGLVEGLFLQGDLLVLCTTMTLAHGMNFPAHLVVIKSTQYYNKEKGKYMEYERSTLLQIHLYQNLLSGTEPVESELLPSISEHLNAEIVLMTVSDVGLAMEWLKCSYLYIRIRKSIHELANYGMVHMDEYGFTLKSLGIQLRRYEKRQLNTINQDTSSRMKFHVLGPNGKTKKRIQTSSEKIFVLVNDALSGEPSSLDFTMTQGTNKWHMADLVSKGLVEYMIRLEQFSSPYIVPVYSASNVSAALISEQYVGIDVIIEPPTIPATNKSSTSIMPSKIEQQKRKLKLLGTSSLGSSVIHEPKSTLKMPTLEEKRYTGDPSSSTLNVKMPISSHSKHEDAGCVTTPPQVYTGKRKWESESKDVGRRGASFPTSESPPGQDLKSLRSFLEDPNVHQGMCSDEEINGLIESVWVDAPPYETPLQPKEEELPSFSLSFGNDSAPEPTTGHKGDGDLVVNDMRLAEIDEECQTITSLPSPLEEFTKTECRKTTTFARDEIRLRREFGEAPPTSEIVEEQSNNVSNSVLPKCALTSDKAALKLPLYPQFSLGLPQAANPEDPSILRYWNVPHNEPLDSSCENNFGVQNAKDVIRSDFGSDAVMNSGKQLSHMTNLETQSESFGSKSLFSFLYD
ncbi:hypothetical protein AXG93_777s1080 [Marchantia polymorpha subsp. ruderalis]|uniref:DNA 3'-5' helicase n=1 Tax=Marchantia polymorpha subsp. ruderalis TaxID=1480154 RepID=A0A176VQN3_MARPO|nr:hypothetical protein AXG93_777s1080 [Marchantia polymorpha subsp. ruderalis]